MINVTEHGLRSDGQTLNTTALQKLLDRTANDGGGIIFFPAGHYLTGGVELRDKIQIVLSAGATLLGCTDTEAYRCYTPPPVRCSEDQEGVRALLYAHGCCHISITGPGTVDGQGPAFQRFKGKIRAGRPRLIWMADCRNVAISDLSLCHSAFWMQHYLHCEHLRLRNLDVYNHGSCNNDGCDIDGCRDVVVSDCNINSHDDAICLKSSNERPTENVVITNCLTRTHCNHFKTGTESNGGFRNITVSNLQMVPSTVLESDPSTGGADYRGASGITLGCVDGGMLENISISHVQMDRVRVPFCIRLGDRGRPIHGHQRQQPVQFARHIRLSGIQAMGAGPCGCHITGLPEAVIENVTINDCLMDFEGDGQLAPPPPLRREGYPACDMYGPHLPAYAVFARHTRDLHIDNLNTTLQAPDPRPALAWQECRNLRLQRIQTD